MIGGHVGSPGEGRGAITRRRFLGLFLIGGTAAALAACTPKMVTRTSTSQTTTATPTPVPTQTTSAQHPEPTPANRPPATSTGSTPAPTTTPAPQSISTSGLPANLVNSNPAQVDNSSFPVTPIDDLGVTASPPQIDMAKYRLSVDGLVHNPLALSYGDILQRQTVTQTVLLICPGSFAGNAQWTGVPLATLLAEAGLQSDSAHVIVYSIDGSGQPFPIDEVQTDGVFLAHTVDGQALPIEHGYPLRLVVKGQYGAVWVKWVDRIAVT